MGLDISYYNDLERDNTIEFDENGEPVNESVWDTHVQIWVNDAFPERADSLEDGWYKGECDGSFRAGSYGGYNHWRRMLCLAALGCDPARVWDGECVGEPFVELINFSDCEGTIGPKTSAKLAKDFANWEHKIGGMVDDDEEYFMNQFYDWKIAFEVASENGAVVFH